jgi:hypothetical protein
VRPGAATEYLDAVREWRQPVMNDHGHQLVGLYEVLFHDYEVCTVWATDSNKHVQLGKSFDVARGYLDAPRAGVDGDSRLIEWRRMAGQWTVQFREEVMTPAPGTVCGPDDYEIDDSVLEARAARAAKRARTRARTARAAKAATKTATKKTTKQATKKATTRKAAKQIATRAAKKATKRPTKKASKKATKKRARRR